MLRGAKVARTFHRQLRKWRDLQRSGGTSLNSEKMREFKERPAIKGEKSGTSSKTPRDGIPRRADYVVVGGGVIGSAIAYSMKQRALDGSTVMVIERDPKYSRSSSTLSCGGIRTQFSLPENIQLSMYSAEFLRNIQQHLSVSGDEPPDIQFQPYGYLFLASEAGAERMIENHKIQMDQGAKVQLLSPDKLKQKFPWLNTDGIELGSHGLENEGWFDPWSLLSAFKKKAVSLGANYVNGEVFGFELDDSVLEKSKEITPNYRTNLLYLKDEEDEVQCVEFGNLIVAAGAFSAEIAEMLRMGSGPGRLKVPLPVEPRKRYVYVIDCQNGPGMNMPFTIDPTGAYMRKEGSGGKYLCGRSPSEDEEPDVSDLEVDYNFFESHVWPAISHRVPAFECIKVSSAWAGYYEYNTLDQNALFGLHPHYPNIYFATGFSGHGIQMAPGVGRAMAELLVDGGYSTIDMSRFHLDRILDSKPVYEKNVV